MLCEIEVCQRSEALAEALKGLVASQHWPLQQNPPTPLHGGLHWNPRSLTCPSCIYGGHQTGGPQRLLVVMLAFPQYPDTTNGTGILTDQARGGAMQVNGAAYMPCMERLGYLIVSILARHGCGPPPSHAPNISRRIDYQLIPIA